MSVFNINLSVTRKVSIMSSPLWTDYLLIVLALILLALNLYDKVVAYCSTSKSSPLLPSSQAETQHLPSSPPLAPDNGSSSRSADVDTESTTYQSIWNGAKPYHVTPYAVTQLY